MLTEEIKLKNYEIFLQKIEKYGVSKETIESVFGNELINATYAIDNQSHLAYEGSLLNTVLRTLIPYSLKLNDILPDNIKCDKDTIIKIGLIQHLAKSNMFIKNDNNWEIEKLGKMFKFAPNKIALRTGAKALAIAFKLGLTLTDNEIEAITIIDKDSNDEQAKLFATPLAVIIRQANELTLTENIFK